MRTLHTVVAVLFTLPQTGSAQVPAPGTARDAARALARAEATLSRQDATQRTSMRAVERSLAEARARIGRQERGVRDLERALVEARLAAPFPTAAFTTSAPEAWAPQDPADSLYRRARAALNRNGYAEAAELFQQIRSRYPRSSYAPDAYYWQAYAMYRRGGQEPLRAALALLREQESRHADASTRKSGDAVSLAARIQGALARSGDEPAARAMAEYAIAAAAQAPAPPSPTVTPRPPRPPRALSPLGFSRQDACRQSEDDVQAVALQSLMQMDQARALPILKQVLARRDEASLCLRRRAVFIVSQYESAEVEGILLTAARTDPDPEVRTQAVHWLSQVDSPRAVAALDSIAQSATDPEIQERAIFALGQHEGAAARAALRRYAERSNISDEMREKALFWIGQSGNPDDIAFLRSLYGRIQQPELRQRILFAIGQSGGADAPGFLLQVARNTSEPLETRKQALFWLSQQEATPGTEFVNLYGSFADREIKEHLIFAMAQRDDRASIDKLIDIARREPQVELRKRAIFWLSQSDDPRVADLLAELLVKP